MVVVAGDTLTYTLGAMRPETAKASVITADEDAKQLALNKVVDIVEWTWIACGCGHDADFLLLTDLFRVSVRTLLVFNSQLTAIEPSN